MEINLVSDWTEIMLNQIEILKSEGFKFPTFEDWKKSKKKEGNNTYSHYQDELIFLYVSLEVKIPPSHPRKIKIHDSFVCPEELIENLHFLSKKIVEGESLRPHLSRKIFDPRFCDGMLFDWGIHHFHLGMTLSPKNEKLVQGANKILFAKVTSEEVYFLDIDEHNKWEDKRFLNIINENYPHLLTDFVLKPVGNVKYEVDEKHLSELRKGSVNTIHKVGTSLYSSIGMGLTSNRGSMKARLQINETRFKYKRIEWYFRRIYAESLCEKLTKDNQETIRFKLKCIELDRVTLFSEVLSCELVLFLDPEWNNIIDHFLTYV